MVQCGCPKINDHLSCLTGLNDRIRQLQGTIPSDVTKKNVLHMSGSSSDLSKVVLYSALSLIEVPQKYEELEYPLSPGHFSLSLLLGFFLTLTMISIPQSAKACEIWDVVVEKGDCTTDASMHSR